MAILISKHESSLIDVCRYHSDGTLRLDRLIKWHSEKCGYDLEFWHKDSVPYLLDEIHRLWIKLYGIESFLRRNMECHKSFRKYHGWDGDFRCVENTHEGHLWAELYYWTGELAWINISDYVVGTLQNEDEKKSEDKENKSKDKFASAETIDFTSTNDVYHSSIAAMVTLSSQQVLQDFEKLFNPIQSKIINQVLKDDKKCRKSKKKP